MPFPIRLSAGRLLPATAVLLALALPLQAGSNTVTLTQTPETAARTYLFCMTGDDQAVTRLLRSRLESAGLAPQPAQRTARTWVGEGYCMNMLNGFDARLPGLRQTARTALDRAGFLPSRPVTAQLRRAPDKRDALVTAFQTLSNVIKLKAEPDPASGATTCTRAAGNGAGTSFCDRS